MKVRYLINGKDVQPINRKEIYLEINHDQQAIINQPTPHVGIKNLTFGREDILKILQTLNSSPGITEGASFDIVITEGGQTETIHMYFNFMDGFKNSENGIECSIKMLQSLDWLDDRANSFTLESMYNEPANPIIIDGISYTSYQDYFDKKVIFIPYVISSIPNYQNAFMAVFSIIYISNELYKVIKQIIQWSTPLVGIGLVLGVTQLILEITYALLLIAALIVMIIQLINCLIQDIKYHGSMLVIDMLKIISHKMGLEFKSSIWDVYPYNQIAYLPEKYNPIEDANPNGFNIFGVPMNGFAKRGFTKPGYATPAIHNSMTSTVQKGYYNGLGGDFLRLIKTFCNGKLIIPNQTSDLVMERRDWYPSNTPFKLKPIRQDWNGYNTDELFATITISFENDFNDKNSIDKYIGTIFQATTQQISINDIRKVNLQGLREIKINASRGIRKTKLDFIEKAIATIEKAWNVIWDIFVIPFDILIASVNILIAVINVLIDLWNLLMTIIGEIIAAIEDIYNLINSLLGGSNGVQNMNTNTLMLNKLQFLNYVTFKSLKPSIFTNRIGALLLENDMVTTPKLLLVDINRPEFTESGGYSGQKRIAYLHQDNESIVNAQNLWNEFYFIDSFIGNPNNRYTKISPATNHIEDQNPTSLGVKDFKNLVSNPKFKDGFGDDAILESAQWHIEKNGMTTLDFRKHGWIEKPNSLKSSERSKEIAINLQINTSVPNGQ